MKKEIVKKKVEEIVEKFLTIPKKEIDGMKEEQIKLDLLNHY